jgi:hypothetical protein
MSKADLIEVLGPARLLHSTSPFIAHVQNWPRGRVGDFEAVELLMNQRNRAEPGTIGFWLEQYALNSAIAQQHRNKVLHQAHLILETVVGKRDKGAAILSIGCGSSLDISQIKSALTALPGRFVLVDSDQDALELSRLRLAHLAERVTLVNGNVFEKVSTLKRLGPFDLIIAGGLFDYLSDRLAEFLIRIAVHEWLTQGGRLFFTNIASGNPFRYWIDFLANWTLKERSMDQLQAMTSTAAYGASTSIEFDPSHLTFFVTVTKPTEGTEQS